jgi:hypothetical protein
VQFVKQNGTLQSHDDVPDDIRKQLFTDEQEQLKRRPQKQLANCSTPFPPINITNVLPPSHQSPLAGLSDSTVASVFSLSVIAELDIPKLRDVAVKMYSEWHQSKVANEMWKVKFQKACDTALNNGLT